MTDLTLTRIDAGTRWRLHLGPLVAVAFLAFYGQVVCPFIDAIMLSRVMLGLGLVCVLQIALREGLYRLYPEARAPRSLARHGFFIAVVSWLVAGELAVIVHAVLYPDFPPESHLKLLVGYWALGGGVLSQLEYIGLEQFVRGTEGETPATILGRMAPRLIEGYAVFTIVPAAVMVLMAYRFVYEGYAALGVALEVTFLGASFVAAALFIAWRYGQAQRHDCDRILEALEMVTEGYYDVRLDASRPDELGRVADSINDMAQGLMLRERIRDAFGRFVNPQVAEEFIAKHAVAGNEVKLGGRRCRVAVLLSDLRDFTALSEDLEPEALTSLLNGYFGEMVLAIRNHGGMVDKFMGDAVMAVFGLDDGEQNSAAAAVAAALEMRHRLELFNQSQRDQGRPTLSSGIGIHFGQVVAGYIGSADRLEFTVIGPTVNLAARLESETKPPHPPLLFSAEVAERAAGVAEIRPVGSTQLKGVSGEVALYTAAEVEN